MVTGEPCILDTAIVTIPCLVNQREVISHAQIGLDEIVSLPLIVALLRDEGATVGKRQLALALPDELLHLRGPDSDLALEHITIGAHIGEHAVASLILGLHHALAIAYDGMVVEHGLVVKGLYEVLGSDFLGISEDIVQFVRLQTQFPVLVDFPSGILEDTALEEGGVVKLDKSVFVSFLRHLSLLYHKVL